MPSSSALDDNNRSTPLNPKHANLNESLQTQHLDLDDNDDSSVAHATRSTARFVGSVCTPKQVLGVLRVLKAITLVFLVLSMLADAMYIIFVEFASSKEVKTLAGGNRDTILRLYGLGLSFIGLAIELDYARVIKKLSALKGFLPRAFLYFFIAVITGSHPILLNAASGASSNADQNYNNDDAANGENDDAANDDAANDDAAANDDYASSSAAAAATELSIPHSAVGFQRVTSFVLACCAFGYLVCGLLCLDRLTARAFLSNKDPRVTTAIPSAVDMDSATQSHN